MKKYMVKESQYKPLENKIIGLEPLGGKDPIAHMSDLKAMENRIIDAITISLKPIVDRLDQIDTNQRNTNSRLDRIETDISDLKTRMTKVENSVEDINTRLDQHDKRFEKIEKHIGL